MPAYMGSSKRSRVLGGQEGSFLWLGVLGLAGAAGGERREGGRGGPDGSRSCSPRCKKQMQSSTAEAKQAREQAAVGLVFLLMISRLATTKGKSDKYSEHSRTLGP